MLFRLNTLSLVGDEGFTAEMVQESWLAMLSDLTRIDYNMSLHYIVLKLWTSLAGTSEVALRLPSLVAAVASLIVFYRLVGRLFDPRVAQVATVLLALNPYFLRAGLFARPYAFLILWSVCATLVVVRALEEPTRKRWLLYGVVAVIGLHIHLLAALIILSHGVFAIVYQRGLKRFNFEAGAIILVFGLLPTAAFLAPTDTLAWIGAFRLGQVVVVALAVAGDGAFAVVGLALAALGLLRPAGSRNGMTWLPAISLIVPIAVVLALAPIQSLFDSNYFAMISAPLAVLIAFGLLRLFSTRESWLVPVGLVLATIGATAALATNGIGDRQDWRGLARMMDHEVSPGDAVAFPNSYYRIVAEYYAADEGQGPYPPGQPILPNSPWGTLSAYDLDFLKRTGVQADHAVFEPVALAEDRIWIVGIGDQFDASVESDLLSHGYVEAKSIMAHGVGARLYIQAGDLHDHDESGQSG
jgi:mannosyltransferase